MKKSEFALFLILAASFVLALYLYPRMPESMASHWDYKGDVNGYMPKFYGLFLLPFLMVVLACLFRIIPKIDPLGKNIQEFRGSYDWFVSGVAAFLFYVYALTIFWNLGYRFDMAVLVSLPLGVLFYGVGALFGKAKQNWFIGIRTPWTLSSKVVWERTHARGSVLFKSAGVLAILGSLLGLNVLLVVALIMLISIYLVVFSYFEYRRSAR